jgi:hypothetical protein
LGAVHFARLAPAKALPWGVGWFERFYVMRFPSFEEAKPNTEYLRGLLLPVIMMCWCVANAPYREHGVIGSGRRYPGGYDVTADEFGKAIKFKPISVYPYPSAVN